MPDPDKRPASDSPVQSSGFSECYYSIELDLTDAICVLEAIREISFTLYKVADPDCRKREFYGLSTLTGVALEHLNAAQAKAMACK